MVRLILSGQQDIESSARPSPSHDLERVSRLGWEDPWVPDGVRRSEQNTNILLASSGS